LETDMSSTAIATVVKMMERLPAGAQEQVVDHLREYLADLEDEALWDEEFAHSQEELAAAARRARQAIEVGEAGAMDIDRLRG
jgi:hypothetical protein